MPNDPHNPSARGQPGAEKILPYVREAVAVGEHIRQEHGRDGVRRYVTAMAELLPLPFVEQLADFLGVERPQPRPKRPPRAEGMPPEKLLPLLQAMSGGKDKEHGVDPMTLMKLFQK